MSSEIQTIDVDVPVEVAYAQWTQFESFPHFMKGVEQIRQLDDVTTEWTVEIAGVERTFTAKISEQTPNHRIAWKATEGLVHAGVVTFHALSDTTSRVTLQMDFEPEGFVETAGDVLGFPELQARGDLKRFKKFIENTGRPTGSWDGKVDRETEASEMRKTA